MSNFEAHLPLPEKICKLPHEHLATVLYLCKSWSDCCRVIPRCI